MQKPSRHTILFALIALVGAVVITRGSVNQPGYTDAYYHFNAAERLVSGAGLTDETLWTYVTLPDELPAPSHQYWMPFASLLAAASMGLFNAPGDYTVAQLPFTLMLAGTAGVGFWLGGKLGSGRRHAWVAGLVTLFSGFFTRFWGATDTFAPYSLVGSLCLVLIGLGISSDSEDKRAVPTDVYWGLAGVFAGLGHLTRADGLLLLIVAWTVILWHRLRTGTRYTSLRYLVILTLGYLLIMTPWFVRSIEANGTPLPVGGTQALWYTEYNDLFSYPVDANAGTFFADGLNLLITSRWEALTNNLGTFTAVEGLVVMTPLMLIGLWQQRRESFLRGFWLYALGLHLAMTLIFPFPGYRGGLFHSAAALVPWWAALGVVGLDDTVNWIAQRRRTWNAAVAKGVFSVALVVLAIALSLSVISGRRTDTETPRLYRELSTRLPTHARVMINDPAALYYYTGLGGVVLPNEAPDIIPEIARRYGVGYLLVEILPDDGRMVNVPAPLVFDPEMPPTFLEPVELELDNMRLYAIHF